MTHDEPLSMSCAMTYIGTLRPVDLINLKCEHYLIACFPFQRFQHVLLRISQLRVATVSYQSSSIRVLSPVAPTGHLHMATHYLLQRTLHPPNLSSPRCFVAVFVVYIL